MPKLIDLDSGSRIDTEPEQGPTSGLLGSAAVSAHRRNIGTLLDKLFQTNACLASVKQNEIVAPLFAGYGG